MLVALGGADAQVKGHVAGNSTSATTAATCWRSDQLLPFIGYPRTLNGLNAINEIAPHRRKMTVAQRIWLITGISSGFGRHLTEQLLDRGDRVVGTVRRPELGSRPRRASTPTCSESRCSTSATPRRCVTVVERTVADLGRIDVVVSNAGYGVFGAAEELSDEQVDGILATNLTGQHQLIRAVLPHMREAGGGRIVQLSSYGGQVAFPGNSLYHATKWGIEGFCESVARKWRRSASA